MKKQIHNRGFTLIELSIVLVIIGLIIGGVLVGQELVGSAATRAQITQIQKYNTAVNTFKIKYGYLPGDIPNPYAVSFGLASRGQYEGEGDGNGIIEGVGADALYSNWGFYGGTGETAMAWVDLSVVRMLDGNFNTASPTVQPSTTIWTEGTPNIGNYCPYAKLGNTLYVYIFSQNNINYFGVSALYEIQQGGCNSCLGSNTGVTVTQANNIDKKIDDGYPMTGKVTAQYSNYGQAWAGASNTAATPGSISTCYDNHNTLGATQQYSMEISSGANANCALSFQFQ